MPTPSLVKQATTHNFLGSSAAFNILKPTIDSKEYKTFGEEDITGLMEVMGSKNPIRSLQYRHFEDDRLHTIVKATGTSGGADTAVVYTVAAAYTETGFPSTFDPYLLASAGDSAPNASGTTTLHPVRLNEGILFPDGVTRGTVTARNATTFTVTPEKEGESLPTLVGTESIVLMGVTNGEGGNISEGVNTRQDVYDNVLQIMDTSAKATGSSLGEQTWVEYDGLDGNKNFYWYFKQQKDTYKRFKNERELNMVIGERVTSTSALATGQATLLKTEGLYTFAASYNGKTLYNIAAGLSKNDFTNLIINSIDANNGAHENAIMASIRLRAGIDEFIGDEMQSGAVVYNTFDGGKDQAVNFGFNSFIHLGYTFHLKTYDLLNNPTILGAISSFANGGLVLPLDKTSQTIGYDKKKETVGSFRMNYMMGSDSNSRDMEEFVTGGTNGIYTNTNDSVQLNLRSHFGFEGFGAARFNLMEGI